MISLLLDHLLESTLFALLIGALTLCFARERAAVRYGLWFAASAKFLIPFSLIVKAGELLRWEAAPAVTLDVSWAAPVVSSGFQLPAVFADMATPLSAAVAASVGTAPTGNLLDLESTLLVLWAAGSVFLLFRWTLQWRRLHAGGATATRAAMDLPIPVHFSRTLFTPALVGVFRPVLFLPEGIAAQLSPKQLAFVIEHELTHWRRRDNMTGAIHMAVELVFWFHPLVWWIGGRLVTERERACDESILAAGNDPMAYADTILEVCRFYVRSPLACTAGMAGANLKDRVERILENTTVSRLSAGKSLLLSSVAAGALLLPIAVGLLTPPAAASPRQADPAAARPAAVGETQAPRRMVAAAVKPTRKPARTPTPASAQIATGARASEIPALPMQVTTTDAPGYAAEQMAAATSPAAGDVPPPPAATPPSSPLEEIIVNSKRIREYVRTRNFVRTYTAPSSFLDQVSRWGAPLCVSTEGLAAAYNAFVTARVKDVATQIGVPQATNESCDVNVSVIFTTHPQLLLDHIRTERPELLGPHYPARRKELATVTHPIQAWYATGTRDSRGRWSLDRYDWNEPIPGEGPPVYYTLGSHLRTGMTSEFASVVIVADIAKVQDYQMGAVADYIAMTALARMKTVDKCQQLPSISNVLGNCGEDVTSPALSDYDMAYLKAVYTSTSDAPRRLQESGIGYYMVKILEDQVAARRSATAK